jgi:hypothetical protein
VAPAAVTAKVEGRGAGAAAARCILVAGGEVMSKGRHATSPVLYSRRARWVLVYAATARAAGREARLRSRPLRAAHRHDPLRRICKRE